MLALLAFLTVGSVTCSALSNLGTVFPPDGTASANTPTGQNLLQNPGFELSESGLPERWTRDLAQSGNKGDVLLDRTNFRSGTASLRLVPNSRNGGSHSLAIFQVIPGKDFRGRTVTFSGYLRAEGGAKARLGMLNFVGGRPSNLVEVEQIAAGAGWVKHSETYPVPDDPSVQLVLTCHVEGTSGSAWFDDLSIVVGSSGPDAPPVVGEPASIMKATVAVDARNVVRSIPRTLYGTNVEWIWGGNLLWKDKENRLDPELTRLVADLGVSLVRFPGGQYSDFYHWKDGTGPQDRRPETLHASGKSDRSKPTLGTDEVLDFSTQVGGELLITVNAGTGTATEAADWVRYVNGTSRRVRFWEVGNELYMNEGSATSRAITVDPATYASRFLAFAREMRAADPGIKLVAIGGENQGSYASLSYPKWNETVLKQAGDQMDYLAVHNAYAPMVLFNDNQDLRTVYRGMLAAPVLIARNLETVARQIDQFSPGNASRIRIAVTEWGPYFQMDPNSRYVAHVKTLGSALFSASVLKTFIESRYTDIANFFLLNDVSVLGWIGTRNAEFPPKPDWTPTASYYAFQMYTRHFGEQLVSSNTTCPTFDSEAVGLVDPVEKVPYLDIVSSLGSDGETLHILAINKNFDSTVESEISILGFTPRAEGTAWTLNGTAIDANTGTIPLKVPGLNFAKQATDREHSRYTSGGPGEITMTSAPVTGISKEFTYRFPPHSVTSIVMTRAR